MHTLSVEERRILDSIQESEVVGLLQALIQARSDFPPGDCVTAVSVIADKLTKANIPFDILANNPHQPNLVATLPGNAITPTLLYHAHVDTVAPGDPAVWRHPPFSGVVEDGLIYGRGAGDDKSSVAAQVMALVTLARAGVKVNGRFQVVVVSDEESGAKQGTRWLRDNQHLQPDFLVVGEQTQNRVAVAERVACGIDLTIFGKSTHGAMPWAGDNAVLKTARVLVWLEKKLFPQLAAKSHPYLPSATLNIGKITGGLQWNIVPETCKVEMDRRLLPGETREAAMAEIEALLDEYNDTIEPLQYELFSTGKVAPNINTDPNEPFVQCAKSALQVVTGQPQELTGYVQTSDGRWFAGDGFPIIIVGPSDPAVGHATNEHVSVEQLVEATKFLTLLALRWLNQTK
ncbi:MAG: M20 family metallopeptidase [Ardenticatenaceae bacterium]|nr:M20 family metallopeptidase [Ardenticatenaceae bacterium]MCB9446024.1 M20 family metallopeptidase [Ardenticatenaceae bacterium]